MIIWKNLHTRTSEENKKLRGYGMSFRPTGRRKPC